MATTSPDNIYSPDLSNPWLQTVDLAAMADSVQDALNNVRGGQAYQVGTDAERLALSGSGRFKGLIFYTTDTNLEWRYDGSAWVRTDTGDIALTLNGGWTSTSGTATVRVRNGIATLNSRLATSAGATTSAFTLPVGARPSSQRVSMVSVGGTTGVQAVVINSNGGVSFPDMTIPTGDYRLASIPGWPVA